MTRFFAYVAGGSVWGIGMSPDSAKWEARAHLTRAGIGEAHVIIREGSCHEITTEQAIAVCNLKSPPSWPLPDTAPRCSCGSLGCSGVHTRPLDEAILLLRACVGDDGDGLRALGSRESEAYERGETRTRHEAALAADAIEARVREFLERQS